MSESIQFVCGACFHWAKVEVKRQIIGAPNQGVCFGAPPSVRPVLDKAGNLIAQGNQRPITPQSERACGAFVPLGAMNGASNDAKVPLQGN